VKVGPAMATHAEPASLRHAAEPPPAPDKVRALLPKLADLPHQAENARTEPGLRAEVKRLLGELAARPTQQKRLEVCAPSPVKEARHGGRAAAGPRERGAKRFGWHNGRIRGLRRT
jgi:hypothetical protein